MSDNKSANFGNLFKFFSQDGNLGFHPASYIISSEQVNRAPSDKLLAQSNCLTTDLDEGFSFSYCYLDWDVYVEWKAPSRSYYVEFSKWVGFSRENVYSNENIHLVNALNIVSRKSGFNDFEHFRKECCAAFHDLIE